MLKLVRAALSAAVVFTGATAALAADIIQPPVYEAPPPVVYEQPVSTSGWYIRGDIDYHWSKFRGADYVLYGFPGQTGRFDFGNLKGALSLGAGVGYQVNNYFRTDLTLDHWFKSDFRGQTSGLCGGVPCTSVDITSYSAWLLLANAYAELGTWHGVTPYVGAGIGGAHLKWDDLRNTDGNGTTIHRGAKGWRFAYALHAGASYCLTKNLMADVGYRFTNIEGGRMFEYANGGGPGRDHGLHVHEVRGGLRYQFGGGNPKCGPVETYEPIPVEPPVYK